jgi:hypothetical protein
MDKTKQLFEAFPMQYRRPPTPVSPWDGAGRSRADRLLKSAGGDYFEFAAFSTIDCPNSSSTRTLF